MPGKIEDRREERPNGVFAYGFIVATDSFMSGWGGAEGGRSLYAVEVESEEEAYTVLANAKSRGDMKRARFVKTLDSVKRNLRRGDHLSITDKHSASRWFEPGGFSRGT